MIRSAEGRTQASDSFGPRRVRSGILLAYATVELTACRMEDPAFRLDRDHLQVIVKDLDHHFGGSHLLGIETMDIDVGHHLDGSKTIGKGIEDLEEGDLRLDLGVEAEVRSEVMGTAVHHLRRADGPLHLGADLLPTPVAAGPLRLDGNNAALLRLCVHGDPLRNGKGKGKGCGKIHHLCDRLLLLLRSVKSFEGDQQAERLRPALPGQGV